MPVRRRSEGSCTGNDKRADADCRLTRDLAQGIAPRVALCTGAEVCPHRVPPTSTARAGRRRAPPLSAQRSSNVVGALDLPCGTDEA